MNLNLQLKLMVYPAPEKFIIFINFIKFINFTSLLHDPQIWPLRHTGGSPARRAADMMLRGSRVADLPPVTVTLLFTGIDGSTALCERDRAAMAAAVEHHIALLDAVSMPTVGSTSRPSGMPVKRPSTAQ
jgi:hypothetical protein